MSTPFDEWFGRRRTNSWFPDVDSMMKEMEKLMQEAVKIIDQICKKYLINRTLAENIFDSQYYSLFEMLASHTSINPAFIISKLTEDLGRLERQGYDSSILNKEDLFYLFEQLDKSRISKESIQIILEKLLRKEDGSVKEIIEALVSEGVTENDLDDIIEKIIVENEKIISQKGMDSIGLLMGRCMSVLRGKVDGEKVNKKLVTRLTEHLHQS